MAFSFNGKQYSTLLGSDVTADGMYLEMQDDAGKCILLAFHSDVGEGFKFYCFEKELPFEVVEHFMAEARQRLAARG